MAKQKTNLHICEVNRAVSDIHNVAFSHNQTFARTTQMLKRNCTIPFNSDRDVFDDAELNSFLTGKKVHELKAEFFKMGTKAYWSVFVHYQPILTVRDGKVEAGLSDAERTLLLKLKEWRKETADHLGMPVFIIATNAQLVDVVRKAPFSLEALRGISGFGTKKVQAHGKAIVQIITDFFGRKPPEPNQKAGEKKSD